MKPDRPPERASSPQAEAEDDADQSRGEQADGRLTRVGLVDQAEAEREQKRRGTEAQCRAVWHTEPAVDAAEPPRQGELHIAAKEGLLKETDHEETCGPRQSGAKSGGAEQHPAVEGQQTRRVQDED